MPTTSQTRYHGWSKADIRAAHALLRSAYDARILTMHFKLIHDMTTAEFCARCVADS